MNRKHKVAGLVSLLGVATGSAFASPAINGSILNLRVFNDFPGSTLVTTNNYPSTISFNDTNLVGSGYANRHNFRLSDSGGAAEAVFLNGDAFTFSSSITVAGPGGGEAGLNLSPWYSQEVDGQFMINAASGEIACFGGRMPFFSFTNNFGLHYVKGTTIHETMIYTPNGLSSTDPAQMEYIYQDGSGTYSSGWLNFNQTNPNDPPQYGDWGDLNDARLGGYAQIYGSTDPNNQGLTITYGNMSYTPTPEPTSLALLALGGLLAIRRR